MKKIISGSKFFVIIACVLLLLASCEKDKTKYEVRVQNDMYNEFLTLPFMKYNVVEFKLGGKTISDVAYGEYSEYVTVESSTDYELSVKVELFLYDADSFVWKSSGTDTFDLGTTSWVDDETYAKQKIKLQIGDLLQAYAPIFKVYGEE